ncbi:MAG: hypothetical protein RLZZ618_2792 [Pseudomonadota bacterium]|jgi:AcrR family transcriptional regulator
MPHPKDQKARTRQLILQSAAALFPKQGYNATSIDDVMRGCGLTRGGFYAHFSSKSELYSQSLRLAGDVLRDTASESAGSTTVSSDDWLASTFGTQPDGPAARDALSFLALDVACRKPEVREAYSDALKTLSDRLVNEHSAPDRDDDTPFATMAMMVGALAITATLDDEDLKTRIVTACRQTAQTLREGEPAHVSPAFLWSV